MNRGKLKVWIIKGLSTKIFSLKFLKRSYKIKMSKTSGSFSQNVCDILPYACGSVTCFDEKIRYPKYEKILWLQSRAI